VAPSGFNYQIVQSDSLVQLITTPFIPAYWTGDQSTSWATNNAGNTNWSTDAAGATDLGATPSATATLVFSATNAVGPTIATTPDAAFTVEGIQFLSAPTGVTAVDINNSVGSSITIAPPGSSGGIFVDSNAGNVTFGAALPVTASAPQTWNVVGGGANGSSLNMAADVALNAQVTKSGTGTATLSGNNTGSGGFVLSSGRVNLNSASSLGTGSLAINNGTTIANTSGSPVTLTNAGGQTWNGSFSFDGGVGTQNLNTGAGPVTLNANVGVTTNGTASALTVGGAIGDGAGNFGLTKQGTGAMTLQGANTFDGGVNVVDGTLNLDNSSAVGTGALTMLGGAIGNTSGSPISIANNQVWNGSFGVVGPNDLVATGPISLGTTAGTSRTVNTATGNLIVDGVISNGTTANQLIKTGTGTLTLNAANVHTGGVEVAGGTLRIGNKDAIGSGLLRTNTTASTIEASTDLSGANALANNFELQTGTTIAGTQNLQVSGTTTVFGGNRTLTNNLTAGAQLTLGNVNLSNNNTARTLTVTGTADTLISGSIANGGTSAGLLTKAGTSTLTLTGTNTYTGATTISGGVLQLGNGGTTGLIANGSDITNNATLRYNRSNTTTYSGVISGTGTVEQVGAGTTQWTGTNTFTGTTTISSGTLSIGNGGTGGTPGTGNIVNNSNLRFNRSNTGLSIANVISGTGTVEQAGTSGSRTTITSANTYTGQTNVNSGSLRINNSAGLGDIIGGTVVANGAALELNNGISVGAEALTLNGTGAGTGALLNVAGTNTYGGAITVANNATIGVTAGTLNLTGGIDKTGVVLTLRGGTINVNTTGISGNTGSPNSDLVVDASIVNLGVANTYNGPTFIRNGGTINANVSDALPTINGRTHLTMDDTGSGSSVLALGADQAIASLTGASTSSVNLASNLLTIGASTGTTNFAGVISGSGSLVKDSASTQVLSGVNTYTGSTSVNAGTLIVNGTIAGATSVGVNGTLEGTGTLSGATTIAGTHSVAGSGVGTQTFGNDLSYSNASNFVWNLIDNDSGSPGTEFDTVALSGGAINIASTVNTTLVLGAGIDWGNAFWGTNQQWLVFSGAASGTDVFNNSLITLNPAGSIGTAPPVSYFAWSRTGGDIFLNFTAVPEPASFGGGLVLLGSYLVRRRKRSSKN
jgi:fibronectin-binding autotransporter adhesin